ncbi:hypothetical protein M3221_00375 [Domibacillus indicus]|uniref:hypothetical protein n=1 Tax=Domibacillus indicus TaxID=1437523 RepID=UPI00203F700A|nr:hypothetical protein [Domibacillus indicus]MCM3786885.1 hypothetical protein [Domibacillus indicus]
MAGRFAVINVEPLESGRLIVANVYSNESGQLIDQIIRKFESYPQAVALLQEIGAEQAWTSDRELYGFLLQIVGIGAEYKHSDDTADTRRAIEQQADLLCEIFQIEALPPKKPLPKWRLYLITKLEELTIWLRKQ